MSSSVQNCSPDEDEEEQASIHLILLVRDMETTVHCLGFRVWGLLPHMMENQMQRVIEMK